MLYVLIDNEFVKFDLLVYQYFNSQLPIISSNCPAGSIYVANIQQLVCYYWSYTQ